jgi:hypothetical protein
MAETGVSYSPQTEYRIRTGPVKEGHWTSTFSGAHLDERS